MESKDSDGRPIPFDIRFLKMDLSRKRGGDFSELTCLEKVGSSFVHHSHEIINVRRFGSTERPRAIHMRLIFGIKHTGSTDFLEVN